MIPGMGGWVDGGIIYRLPRIGGMNIVDIAFRENVRLQLRIGVNKCSAAEERYGDVAGRVSEADRFWQGGELHLVRPHLGGM